MNHEIEPHGFSIVSRVIGVAEQQELIITLGPISGAGRRGLLALPAVAALARSARLLDIIRPHLPSEPFPVRAICFDKSPEANWLFLWHQDLTLALSARAEVPGFGPWSTKDGIPHVQPPVEFLQQMLTSISTTPMSSTALCASCPARTAWVACHPNVFRSCAPGSPIFFAPCPLGTRC